ncbi:enoyl-CoA hydratase-related protein [Marichromatium purpuratum]|uniref:enoyl-CoA hydratase-related protein n=1 Tax=Marichromatium purpuratum TaxID=37487 RepID=UPI00021E695B|nr:enoyl-CoA hydratase-related protein [Marichromatium purpuratum]
MHDRCRFQLLPDHEAVIAEMGALGFLGMLEPEQWDGAVRWQRHRRSRRRSSPRSTAGPSAATSTGRLIDDAEAERYGLVARVVPAARLLDEALDTARLIAAESIPIRMMLKESVNRAFEVGLAEGVRCERRVFHAAFATHDRREGMAAFIAKREARFEDR